MTPPIKHRPTNPLKRRKLVWLEPGFLLIVGAYVGFGFIGIWWISYLAASVAAITLTILWIVVLPIVILLARRMIYDEYRVNARIVEKTKRDIAQHRITVHKEFIQAELDMLARGERSPVLDIWRLNPQLAGRHFFFGLIESIWLDPSVRELQIRLQLENSSDFFVSTEKPNPILASTLDFLMIVASDPYFKMLRRFFNTLAFEAYAFRENEQRVDVPFPILSVLIPPAVMAKISSIRPSTIKNLSTLGDVRFADGAEVVPHRTIEGRMARGK